MSLPMPGVAENLGGRDGEGMGNTFESFGVPESDQVKKDLTIGAALEGEPGSMLILWIDHGNLLGGYRRGRISVLFFCFGKCSFLVLFLQ